MHRSGSSHLVGVKMSIHVTFKLGFLSLFFGSTLD